MITENFLLNKLNNGKTVIGTWIILPSVSNIDVISSSGLDFIIIDREHGPISFETAQEMSIAAVSRGVSPIMRVGDIERAYIQNALDIGVHGLQVPNIDSYSQAKQVITYAKYPPIGDRGFSPFTRAGDYSKNNSKLLLESANQNVLTILNIEGEKSIANFDEITNVESVDVYFIGLFDLSKSLGLPGEVNHPKVLKKLEEVVTKAHSKGKHVGTIATDIESMKRFVNMGLSYIVYLVDCEILKSSYSCVVDSFRAINNE